MVVDDDEVYVLQKTWQDLADRTNGKGIDKETFLQYFPLTGLLGERLFANFDKKGNGFIDFDEFIGGLAVCCRGSTEEKIKFMFQMFDVSHNSTVSKQELSTLLNHVPKQVLHGAYGSPFVAYSMTRSNSMSLSSNLAGSDNGHDSEREYHPEQNAPDSDYDDVDMYTNHDLVEKCFDECDLNHEGRLHFEEFKMWVERTPGILEYLESILPFSGPKDNHRHHSAKETLPMVSSLRRITSMRTLRTSSLDHSVSSIGANPNSLHSLRSTYGAHKHTMTGSGKDTHQNVRDRAYTADSGASSPTHSIVGQPRLMRGASYNSSGSDNDRSPSPKLRSRSESMADDETDENDEAVKDLLHHALETTTDESTKKTINDVLDNMETGEFHHIHFDRMTSAAILDSAVAKEGYLFKRGKSIFHPMCKRYYLLSGNCMYYYQHMEDVRPKGVIFLTGCLVEAVENSSDERSGYFGIELLHQDLCTGEHHRHDKRILYARSEEDRQDWIIQLQHYAQVVPIEEDYVIGDELGRGRFSTVHECVNKLSNVHYAVKIIDKATIEPEEKDHLRTEIAVLKLVDHPNIIRMEGLYESRKHIYIVMEKLSGGELFERIVGRPRFTEDEAAKLIRPLLESVAYLHDLGIVHRDLKPENILCGDNLEDLKIADFGLSKMILPKERMDAACGTLSYVAPEVLTFQGYGKEADLWSVGVIMFLLLCGKLPFEGEKDTEIIQNTIKADLKPPTVWAKLSEEAKSLIKSLLCKNPRDRITARDALRHPFILTHCPHHKRSISFSSSPSHEMLQRLSSKN